MTYKSKAVSAPSAEQEALEAKAQAQIAENDAAEAIIEAETAGTFSAVAIEKAETAAKNAEFSNRSAASHEQKPLLEAGHAINEAKEAIKIAEDARSNAEEARNKAEEARFSAEEARNKAEEARASAEDTRTVAEEIRGSEEEARIKALDVKRKAEEAKIKAEVALKNSEIAIAESHEARLEAERARDKAIAAAQGLQVYASSLEVINKDLEQFAAVASHDLQAPLRKIRIFSEQVEQETDNKLTPESRDALQRICKSAQSMQDLINDLLALARVSHHGLFVPVDLSEVVTRVLSELDDQIVQKNAVITVESMATVMGDRSQLQQLFQNLIENALKFHVKDSIPKIRISSRCYERACQIIVEDKGIGFEQEYAERIFKTFARLPGVSKFPGSGVGLSICKRIAERHGGDITATSVPGEGSVFTVTLPLQEKV